MDDDTFVRMLFAFDLPDVELIEARSVREAAELLAEHQPDAMVIDRRLPDGDGLQLIRAVRGDGDPGQIPIVLLTAAHDPGQEPEVLRAGADAYMAKPFEAETLMAAVHEVLAVPADERGDVRSTAASNLERGVAAGPRAPTLTVVPPPVAPASSKRWSRQRR
ncbi:MAG TPA: response regulator [Acidimicrobiales bacterium]